MTTHSRLSPGSVLKLHRRKARWQAFESRTVSCLQVVVAPAADIQSLCSWRKRWQLDLCNCLEWVSVCEVTDVLHDRISCVCCRVCELLQSGAVMNKSYQPHEGHIPYLLQLFIDYNMYGMNLLHLGAVKFRRGRSKGKGRTAPTRPSNTHTFLNGSNKTTQSAGFLVCKCMKDSPKSHNNSNKWERRTWMSPSKAVLNVANTSTGNDYIWISHNQPSHGLRADHVVCSSMR